MRGPSGAAQGLPYRGNLVPWASPLNAGPERGSETGDIEARFPPLASGRFGLIHPRCGPQGPPAACSESTLHHENDHPAVPADTPLLRSPGIDKAREKIRRADMRAKIEAGTFTLADLDGLDHATVTETAAVFRADPRTIRAYIKAGKIPATFLGEYRIPCAWLREQAGLAA